MKITLTSLENKMTKAGVPFWQVKDTQNQVYTIWDKSLCDQLVFGQPQDLVVKENAQGFKNIRGVGTGGDEEQPTPTVNTVPSPQVETIVSNGKNQHGS